MLPVMERPNAILKSEFVNNWVFQQLANSDPRTPLMFNYSPDFSILTMESNDFKLKIMESLLIAHDKPILNKADSSLPLELF